MSEPRDLFTAVGAGVYEATVDWLHVFVRPHLNAAHRFVCHAPGLGLHLHELAANTIEKAKTETLALVATKMQRALAVIQRNK